MKIRLCCSFLFFLSFSGFAYADTTIETVEIWECRDISPLASEILVRASVHKGRHTGVIEVAGIEYDSIFSVQGFLRRWSFPLLTDKDFFDYSFIIKPNGAGSYYDFSISGPNVDTSASIYMKCVQR